MFGERKASNRIVNITYHFVRSIIRGNIDLKNIHMQQKLMNVRGADVRQATPYMPIIPTESSVLNRYINFLRMQVKGDKG